MAYCIYTTKQNEIKNDAGNSSVKEPPQHIFFVICSNLLLLQQEQQQAAAHHRRQLLLAAAAARGSRRVYITRRTASSPLLSYASTRELTHTTVPDTERGHETVDIQYNVCTEYITLYMISYQTENKKKNIFVRTKLPLLLTSDNCSSERQQQGVSSHCASRPFSFIRMQARGA